MENIDMQGKAKGNMRRVGVVDDPLVSRLYTPIAVAKEEIWKRWNNADLKKEVEKFVGNDIPDFLYHEPKVALVRHIASPNREAVHFLQVAKQLQLKPVFAEYLSDKFVPENMDKYYLGKLYFYNGKVKENGEDVKSCKIIDIKKADGQKIEDIKTLWDEGFADFHHRVFREALNMEQSFCDMSAWLSRHGGEAKHYYKQYLALFLCHGVLAEVFLTYNRKEDEFFERIIVPAMEDLENLFGIMPLMTPLFDQDTLMQTTSDDELHWMHYPDFIQQYTSSAFAQ